VAKLTGVHASVPFLAQMRLQGGLCACVVLTRTQTRVAQGWGALQRVRHGGFQGLCGGETPAGGVPAARVRYGPRFLAQKNKDDGTVLTEGLT